MDHRRVAFALLRVALGVVFLFSGIGKLMGGIGNFAGKMSELFAGKLPSALVLPFAYSLPFLEVTIGALIVLGLFTRLALALSGALLVALTFGMVMAGDPPTVAHNVQYAFVNFVLLWFCEMNGYAIDRLLKPAALKSQEVASYAHTSGISVETRGKDFR